MEPKWKSVEWEILRRNKLRLRAAIVQPQPQGLKIVFSPSKRWLRLQRDIEPEMRTDLIAGDEHYQLPRYFRAKTIKTIEVLLSTSVEEQ